MFIQLQKLLPKAMQSLGVAREVTAALVCEKYRKLAPEIIHAEALTFTKPLHFRGKTLTIGVRSSAWAGQIISKKQELLNALNKSLGKTYVTALRTQMIAAS